MKKFIAIILLSIFSGFVFADSLQNCATSKKSDIGYADGIALGLVEGITEFLPVSSTGHLILANEFLELDGNTPIIKSNGGQILDSKGNPYTMKALADAYAIVIQLGSILAVALLYREDILEILRGLFGNSKRGRKLLINLFVAFLPAALIGLLLNNFIEKYLFGIYPVIFALAAGAGLMWVVQKIYDKRVKFDAKFASISDMTIRQSLMVGFLQCIAMWPGTSRSMMTILGGYLAGLKATDAAKFSFLLGLITLSAASCYKMAKDGSAMLQTLSWGPLLVGLIIAFLSAAISVKWLVGFLNRRGLIPFAWYRIAIAIAIFAFMWFDIK